MAEDPSNTDTLHHTTIPIEEGIYNDAILATVPTGEAKFKDQFATSLSGSKISADIQRIGESTLITMAGEASTVRAKVNVLKSEYEGTEVAVSSTAPYKGVAIVRTEPGAISKLGSSGNLNKTYPTEALPAYSLGNSPNYVKKTAAFAVERFPLKEVTAVGIAATIGPSWQATGITAIAAGIHCVANVVHGKMGDKFDQAGNDAALGNHLTVRSLQNQVQSLQIHKELAVKAMEMELKIEEEKTKRAKIEEEEKTKREEEKTKRAKIEEGEKTKRARIELEARKLELATRTEELQHEARMSPRPQSPSSRYSCCQSVSRMSPRPRKSLYQIRMLSKCL